MNFDTYFRFCSYAMIATATIALVLAGGLHLGLALLFAGVMIAAWRLEGTKWQLSERVGLVVVLLAIPLFFADWQYQKAFGELRERIGVSALSHLIIFLSAVKLLQIKSDRDWVFLYLISFFEVLLAAGLSFSPIFLATLALYVFFSLTTVIAFEITKARRTVPEVETRLLVAPDAKVFQQMAAGRRESRTDTRRLPAVAAVLLVLIFVLALPLFLVAPRAGSAALTRAGAGLTNFIGFSENVTLGEIGTLKASNEIVMRARLEGPLPTDPIDLRWRGVALDEFNGRSWRKSAEARQQDSITGERGFFQVGTTSALHRLTSQTVFLEPIESSVLFTLPHAVALQGDFQSLRVDRERSIQSRRPQLERTIYKVLSDTTPPDVESLRNDMQPYTVGYARYQRLPNALDPRIADRARAMIVNHNARTRYEIAKAIEAELQTDFGYSLEMKASGPDPLADFLFNVKAGHCEYFSTAMVVMLRTHGVAARVVNGFLPGEYNETAGAFTVRQSDAHSWVEVYFPKTNSWVTFDPTPAAGRTEPQSTGVAAQLSKYAEALELIWFQYVIGYDKQEQRSLATSMQNQAFRYQQVLANGLAWVRSLSWQLPLLLIVSLLLLSIAGLLALRVKRFGWRGLPLMRKREERYQSAVAFYERLTTALARQGIERRPAETPLEFAAGVGSPEVVRITSAYNRVRYGAHKLSRTELEQIESALKRVEDSD
jgi:transglutaminase-like putative cysteine protease